MITKIEYADKNWGRTAIIGVYNNVLIYQAFVDSGKSSVHHHDFDFNVIISIDATIIINFFDNGFHGEPSNIVVLGPGQKINIVPKRVHQFVVDKKGSILEIYYSDEHRFDIHRYDV